MAIAKRMMGGGLSSGQARAINGDSNSAVSAAGTTQGTATTLYSAINVVTTAAASSGVIMENVEIGDEYDILNLGANAVTIYPPTGCRINQLATNSGFLLATNTAVKVMKFSSTRFMAFLSA